MMLETTVCVLRKEKLNYSLGNITFQNENAYFYLGILGAKNRKTFKFKLFA